MRWSNVFAARVVKLTDVAGVPRALGRTTCSTRRCARDRDADRWWRRIRRDGFCHPGPVHAWRNWRLRYGFNRAKAWCCIRSL